MYEQLGLDWISPLGASAVFGMALGLVFGSLALLTRFCLRRALVGDHATEQLSAATVWLTALAAAIIGTQASVMIGWIDFSDHRFLSSDLPVALIAVGGLLFGSGMILTRGCASRLTVLAGSGNVRAMSVILIFAVVAHATLKGIFAPVRTALAGYTVDISSLNSYLQTPYAFVALALAISVTALATARKSNTSALPVIGGISIGLLVPLGWVGTGFVLQDDFDPIAFQSLSFTSSSADWLFWSIASSSIGAGFGVGLLSGVILGSAVTALVSGRFKWESFSSPAQTGRYSLGAAMMGMGGVLAGGCTVGAGLTGVSSMSISAILTLVFIITGGLLTDALVDRRSETAGDVQQAGALAT